MNIKKMLGTAVSSVMIASLIGVQLPAYAEETLTYQGFTYEKSDGSVTITGVPDESYIKFPAEIDGLPVTEVAEDVIDSGVERVYLSENISSFPVSGRISGCSPLAYIEVSPANQTYTSVDGILYSKDMTELISVPNGMSIDVLDIPDTVVSTNWGATNGADFRILKIPASLRDIDYSMVSIGLWSGALERVEVAEDNPNYYSMDGVLYSRARDLMLYPPQKEGAEYIIPEDIECVSDGAIRCSSNLRNIVFPSGLEVIGWVNADSCSELRSVFLPKSVTYVGIACFSYCDNLTDIYYEGSEEEFRTIETGFVETEIFADKEYLKGIEIHYNSTGIPEPDNGDVDGSGSIDAVDASLVLSEYAAIAVGRASVLTSAEKNSADADKNGTADAVDASIILSYYAYTATGGSSGFEEFVYELLK